MAEEPEDAPEHVFCSFWDHKAHDVVSISIDVTATLGPKSVGIRHSCDRLCKSKGYPMWAQPSGIEDDDVWLVFRYSAHGANLVRPFPSKDAAEMWLIHHG